MCEICVNKKILNKIIHDKYNNEAQYFYYKNTFSI